MSVAASSIDSSAPPSEPFGQTGVRQYFGRILAWVCLTIGLCAWAMSQRSSGFVDVLEWRGRGQVFQILSGNAQVAFVGGGKQGATAEGSGWSYQSGPGGRRWGVNRTPWETDLGRALGVEGSLEAPSTDFDTGFWLRLKWGSVSVLFMVWPVLYVLRGLLRWRRRSRERVTVA